MLVTDVVVKPKRRGLSLGSLYLAVGLAVFYLVVTRMTPALTRIVGDGERGTGGGGGGRGSGWLAFSQSLSDWVLAHHRTAIAALAVAAVLGFLLPLLVRPSRVLVWLLALGVFLLDVALAVGGYLSMVFELISQTEGKL